MIENIKHLFKNKDHKKIMLGSLLISSIVIYVLLALSALYMGLNDIFWVKLSVSLIIGVLFAFYIKYRSTPLTSILFIIIIEIDTSFAILNKNFYEFVSIYPFLIIFGFFFFFRLKTALWMCVAHFTYWTIITIIRYKEVADHPMFESVLPDINMFTTSAIVVLLGLFYHLSMEVSYKKLEESNEKNENILKEIHHRIKNNLNMIASIFGLQILSLQKGIPKSTQELLKDNKMRVEAIAMIHESLYKNQNIGEVSFKEYTQNLTNLINKAYDRNISVQIDSDYISLPSDTMFHLGIIMNELFTNSIKYAFEDDEDTNQVWIALSKNRDHFHFVYQESRNEHIDIEKMLASETLGIRLIQLSVKQMSGTFEISRNNGLIFTIIF